MDNREIRNIEQVLQSEGRTVSGYAIRFNEDSADMGFIERINPSALTREMVDNGDIFAYFNHDWNRVLARSPKSLKLDLRNDGLYYEFEAPNTSDGNDLLEHIKRGEMYGTSFAFSLPEDGSGEVWTRNEDNTLIREIVQFSNIFEISPVYTPAYPTTSVSARAMVEKMKEEEPKEEEPKEEEKDEPNENEERQCEEPKEEVKEEPKEEDSEEPKENKTEPAEEKPQGEIKRKINKSKMKKQFSLLKAINDIANNRSLDATAQAVVNEGANEMRSAGQSFSGQIQLPVESRAAVTVTTEHDDVVEVEMADLLTPLRAKNVLVQAGAKYMTGLVGDVQVPIMGAGSVAWEGETDNAPDANYSFSAKKLQPKRLTAYVDVSKQFLVQDSIGAEQAIRADIVAAINSKLESTILGSAAGSTTQPAGMFYGATVNDIASFADICDLEADVEDANVLGECKYICSNKAKAALRTMQKSTNNGGMVMESGEVDGTPVLNTSNVGDENIVYGDFNNLAIGQWGGIDLVVDPYSLAKSGQVRIVINAFFDAVVLRPSAFAFGTTDVD